MIMNNDPVTRGRINQDKNASNLNIHVSKVGGMLSDDSFSIGTHQARLDIPKKSNSNQLTKEIGLLRNGHPKPSHRS